MSESEESNISDECAEQTAPAEVVDLSQGFDSDGWDLYNVENLGLCIITFLSLIHVSEPRS